MQEKDCNTRIVSEEIRKLFVDFDQFLEKKNQQVENIKNLYLNLSTNN